MRVPDKPTTPAQWAVITWSIIVVCLVVAGISFVKAATAEEARPQAVEYLTKIGFVSLGAAAGVLVVYRVIKRVLG